MAAFLIVACWACGLPCSRSSLIAGVRTSLRSNAAVLRMAIPHYVTGDMVNELAEDAAVSMLGNIETVPVTLSPSLATGPVTATFVRTRVSAGEVPPLVVIHGFDSSCLEFRRLMPELERRGIEAYAFDVFGWSVLPIATTPSTDACIDPPDGFACPSASCPFASAPAPQCLTGDSPIRAAPVL